MCRSACRVGKWVGGRKDAFSITLKPRQVIINRKRVSRQFFKKNETLHTHTTTQREGGRQRTRRGTHDAHAHRVVDSRPEAAAHGADGPLPVQQLGGVVVAVDVCVRGG